MCIWYDVGIRLFYIIAMILSNYCIYHDDVKTIVLHAYCKYTTVFRTGLQGRTVCNWLVIPCINIFEIKIKINKKWWRHQMETFSALLAICAGNSTVSGEFPAQRPVTRSFDVFFDLRPNKRLNKQWWGWWFETPLCSLWRHRNEEICPSGFCTLRKLEYLWCPITDAA